MHKFTIIALIATLLPLGAVQARPLPLIKVFCYHNIKTEAKQMYDVSVKEFEKQLDFLKKEGFISLFASELIDALKNPEKLDVSRSYAVITFDDGNDGILKYAFNLLKKYQFKATLYIYPSIIFAKMKNLRRPYMTWDEIKTLLQHPLFELGSHSYYHPHLTKETAHGLKHNTVTAAKTLEKMLGQKPLTFAYPFGLRNENVIKAIKDAGYLGAFSIDGTPLAGKNSLFDLPRHMITKNTSFEKFQSIALGKKMRTKSKNSHRIARK